MLGVYGLLFALFQIGAGLGLCGILASHLGASSVLLTDGDTDTLDNTRANVASNCSTDKNVACMQLVWGRRVEEFVDAHGQFDVIMGADIVYIEQVLEPLFIDTIPKLLKDDGRFLLAYARRNVSIDLVLQFAARAGLYYTQFDGPEGVFVFQKQRTT
jgi:predicted nicotinamide N-methyase